MDTLEKYREIIKRVIREVAEYAPEQEGLRKEMILDDTSGHYQLLEVGWLHKRRIHGTLVHIDLRDGKVWVEHDGTNLEIIQDLLDAGIPPQHIVVGFHPPNHRQFTEFATS